MPPASLSTFAVIIPGPTTARTRSARVFQRLRNFIGTFRTHKKLMRRIRINAEDKFWPDETRGNAGKTNRKHGQECPPYANSTHKTFLCSFNVAVTYAGIKCT